MRIPRWRAVVLCVAGALSMIKPLTSGLEMYRGTGPAESPATSPTYGEVHEAGPYSSDELSRGEVRLRVTSFPRVQFASAELASAAAEVRQAGLAEVRKLRDDAADKARTAWATRSVAWVLGLMGVGGILFYVWLGYVLIREGNDRRELDPGAALRPWLPWRKPRRHGKICFGRHEE